MVSFEERIFREKIIVLEGRSGWNRIRLEQNIAVHGKG